MFYRTEERLRVFKFTSQFYARERGYYWVKACSGTQVNDNDLSALNVGKNLGVWVSRIAQGVKALGYKSRSWCTTIVNMSSSHNLS